MSNPTQTKKYRVKEVDETGGYMWYYAQRCIRIFGLPIWFTIGDRAFKWQSDAEDFIKEYDERKGKKRIVTIKEL